MKLCRYLLIACALFSLFSQASPTESLQTLKITISCNESFSKIQKLISQVVDNCDGSYDSQDLLKSCRPQSDYKTGSNKLEISFQSKDCTNINNLSLGLRKKCQRIVKLSQAGEALDLCVMPEGISYNFENNKQKESSILEVTNSLKSIGCEINGDPIPIMVGDGKVGYHFPTRNCYLLRANYGQHDQCKPGYEKIRLYPVLDSKDYDGNRFVCKVQSRRSKQTNRDDLQGTR